MKENEIGSIVVNTAIDLHKKLGPGLLENVYEVILMKSLMKKGLPVQRQVLFPIEFETNILTLDSGWIYSLKER